MRCDPTGPWRCSHVLRSVAGCDRRCLRLGGAGSRGAGHRVPGRLQVEAGGAEAVQVAAADGVFKSDVGHGGSYTATLPQRKTARAFLSECVE